MSGTEKRISKNHIKNLRTLGSNVKKPEDKVKLAIAHQNVRKVPQHLLRKPKYPEYVKMPKSEFKKLEKKYGKYMDNWHFVSPDTIKVWDGNQFLYRHVASKKIEKVF